LQPGSARKKPELTNSNLWSNELVFDVGENHHRDLVEFSQPLHGRNFEVKRLSAWRGLDREIAGLGIGSPRGCPAHS